LSLSLIADRFAAVCSNRRAAVAIQDFATGEALTFADLAAESTALLMALQRAGIDRGDTVVSVLGNRPLFFSLVVACMELGAALVPLGDATDAEAVTLVEQANATAIVTERPLSLPGVERAGLASGAMLLIRPASRNGGSRFGASVVLKLTSGSTQVPKAAVATEAHLVNDGRHIVEAMGITADDLNVACIPLSHSYALGNLVMPLLWQGTAVVLGPVFNPPRFLHDISEAGATVFPGVPFMFDRLRALGGLERLPASLRLLITAGARIDPETVAWFHRQLHRKVHSFYGSSETGGISYDDSDEIADPLHVGRAMPETSITIETDDPESDGGRVFVIGNAVAERYARHVDIDGGSAFVRGGFRTSDLGYLDGQGRLVLTGRASPLVNVAGRKVDPSEVERRLVQLAGIADARVVGTSSASRGQDVVAFVVRADAALTPLMIRQRCAETLSPHKIPRRFVFLDRLPVDARGKVDRRTLLQLAAIEAGESLDGPETPEHE
jgi:acyl-coenzyme A synthetase/AMP-(fatty) acid ligase